MSFDHLIFVGLNGYAAAIDRETGQVVWSNDQMKSSYVTMLLDGDRLVVSTNGWIYCLDPLTGEIMWHNPMKGFGTGPTALVSVRGQSSQVVPAQAAAADAAGSGAGAT
jgi:outer membrane protein assembly factor BamB